MQVICKERCLGLESSECRDQLDGQPVDSIGITVKLGSVFEQEGKQVVTALRFLRNNLGLFGKVFEKRFEKVLPLWTTSEKSVIYRSHI